MDFYTKIDIPHFSFNIGHKDNILMLGSCFIESIGGELEKSKFNLNLNPFGVLYNPQSIAQALELLIEKREFTEQDLFEYCGLFHSFYHHSRYSDMDVEHCLKKINNSLNKASFDLYNADILILTFGTAYVYRHKARNMIVGNCHKLPASEFDRYRLSVNDIVIRWQQLLRQLKAINPKLKVLFTVSPIRHLKDGAHDNQLSKSTLLLAVEELCQMSGENYFPSYEIVLDELRDYRFYKEDMIHPDNVAIAYIWERFGETFFTADTQQIITEWQKIESAISHRPFNAQGNEYKRFLEQTLLKAETFGNKYPYICCEREIELLKEKIKE